jgi:hypothetical protein
MRIRILQLALILSVAASPTAFAKSKVNCDKGDSINRELAKLKKAGPNEITVTGTCTQRVLVEGFDDLSLLAASGAILNDPADGSMAPVVEVHASRRVLIDGFTINSTNPVSPVLFTGSLNCQVTNLVVNGGNGIRLQRSSYVSILDSQIRNVSIGVLVGNASTGDVRGSLIENTGSFHRTGIGVIAVGGASALVEGITVRGFNTGVQAGGLGQFATFGPGFFGVSRPVVIEDNNVGVLVGNSGFASFSGTATISGNGQGRNGDAGIVVDGGTLTMFPFEPSAVSNNDGQGILAINNSNVLLNGPNVEVANNSLNGVVAINSSVVEFRRTMTGLVIVTGSVAAFDIFCDTDSLVRGTSNVTGAANVSCANSLLGQTPIPRSR